MTSKPRTTLWLSLSMTSHAMHDRDELVFHLSYPQLHFVSDPIGYASGEKERKRKLSHKDGECISPTELGSRSNSCTHPKLGCYQKEKCLRGKGWPHCFEVFEDHFLIEQGRIDRRKILGKETFKNKQEDSWNGSTVPVQKCCGLKPRGSRGSLWARAASSSCFPLLSRQCLCSPCTQRRGHWGNPWLFLISPAIRNDDNL